LGSLVATDNQPQTTDCFFILIRQDKQDLQDYSEHFSVSG